MALLAGASACGGNPASPTQDATALIDTRVAELVEATQDAQQVLGTSVAATLEAVNSLTLTANPPGAPSQTPAPSLTFIPPAPLVSVTMQTNCRSGPGSDYEVLGMLNVGESAEVVGRSQYADYWVIKLPAAPEPACWLWGQYAALRGDAGSLPVIPPPPTPTPGNDFVFQYQTYWDCGGSALVIFNLRNTGSIPWESNQVSTTDLTSGITYTAQRDDFPATFNCSTIGAADDLLAGGQMGSVISASIPGDPSGHEFLAFIRLCTSEGLSGFCMEKQISFTFIP
jgi:hypothetical protein